MRRWQVLDYFTHSLSRARAKERGSAKELLQKLMQSQRAERKSQLSRVASIRRNSMTTQIEGALLQKELFQKVQTRCEDKAVRGG